MTSLSKSHLLPREEMLEVKEKKKKLIIGIPKESEADENRVPITPLGVEMLVNNGHEVIIEDKAGEKANFGNMDYAEHGAVISKQKAEIFKCDIIIKIAPLTEKEIDLLRGSQIVISALHITIQSKNYFLKLIRKRISAFAYEFIQDENRLFPIVRSMSEIAGSASILIAGEFLSNVKNGKGKMLGGITGVNPSEVVIIGAGTAGEFAAKTALGLGAEVKIFDISLYNLKKLQDNIGRRLYTSIIQGSVLENALKNADVLIGAVRQTGNNPCCVVTENMVKKMKDGSVIVDLSVDQEGTCETSKLTTHKKPVFTKHGIIHYCVPNVPSRVARTASLALSNIFAHMILKIAESGSLRSIVKNDEGMRKGLYVFEGMLTNQNIGNKFNIPAKDIDLLMALM